jgi:hypothetical protein
MIAMDRTIEGIKCMEVVVCPDLSYAGLITCYNAGLRYSGMVVRRLYL